MPNPILLVHGAWHGAWSWSTLQRELDLLGVPSYAIDLPGRGASAAEPTGLAGDVEAVAAAVRAIGRPTLLVGHSYGGAVVTGAAGSEPLVAGAVFVAAFALHPGESVMGFLRSAPRHAVGLSDHMRPNADGSIDLDREHIGGIYGDLPDAEIAAHVARLSVQPADTFTGVVRHAPYGHVPTTYVLCEQDDAVHPVHQRMLAARCDRTVTLQSGHFPMLTDPTELAGILRSCAG